MNNTSKMILVISHFIIAFYLCYSLTGCNNHNDYKFSEQQIKNLEIEKTEVLIVDNE